MMTTIMKMPSPIAATVEHLFAHIEGQPEFLLEHPGGPEGFQAHVTIARLIGADEHIDHEMRIDTALPYLLVPKPQRLTMAVDVGMGVDLSPPTLRYDLQSNYAWANLAPSDSETFRWVGVEPTLDTHLWTVLALRYRIAT